MTKRVLLTLAGLALAAGSLSARAQDYPAAPAQPPRPATPAIAPVPVTAPAPVAAPARVAEMTAVVAPVAPAHITPMSHVAAPVAPVALSAPQTPAPALAPLPPMPPQQGLSIFHVGDNFLGISAEEVTRENMGRYGLSGEPRGVGVREVVKDSPAERAGLRAGDLILRFDGEQVSTMRKLNRLIDESAPEHAARLTIRRGGSEQEITVTLGKREAGRLFDGRAWQGQSEELKRYGDQLRRQGDDMRRQMETWRRDSPNLYSLIAGGGRRIGVTTNPLGKQLADYFGVSNGALIASVEDDSPASRAGLRAGDIVTEVDGEKVDDSGDLSRLLNRKEEGEVTLTVVRDRNRRTVRVTPEKRKTPGAFEIRPGSIFIDVPSVAVTVPGIAITAPAINITPPRVTVSPRVTITPRTRVITPERIL
jgi:membrane-associated protease RseP (regulator of RpoE activity)